MPRVDIRRGTSSKQSLQGFLSGVSHPSGRLVYPSRQEYHWGGGGSKCYNNQGPYWYIPDQTKTFKESRVFRDKLCGVRTSPRYGLKGKGVLDLRYGEASCSPLLNSFLPRLPVSQASHGKKRVARAFLGRL